MKKSLIALAVMAAAGAASAQSSVTLFGIVDATLQWTRGGPGDVRFRVTNSGYNSSRLGFRGTEDLGGGMSASFWLEASVFNDDGTGNAAGGGLQFNRRSTVSLAGGWGELRIGRDYTPTFWNLTVFDPFGTNGSGTTMTLQPGLTGPATVRASNSIGYFAPANLGGFYGQAMYAENEVPNNVGAGVDAGRYMGLRVGYAAGPFNVAAAYGRTDRVEGPGLDDTDQLNIGGHWDFGMAKLMGHIVFDNGLNGVNNADGRGFLIGALVPVGAGEIRASYSRYRADFGAGFEPRADKLALGYVHNLSKRTALYATIAHVRNRGGNAVAPVLATVNTAAGVAGVNDSSSAVDLGIRHSF
jgi:predicted porin